MKLRAVLYLLLIAILTLSIVPSCKSQSQAKKSQRKMARRHSAPKDCGCH